MFLVSKVFATFADAREKFTEVSFAENRDLLALYTFTGRVPKSIEQCMHRGCTDRESMVGLMYLHSK